LEARCESHRRSEKMSWLRGSQAIDSFFVRRLKEPLDRMRQILTGRLDSYKQKQLSAARAKREVEAVEAQRQQQEAARTRAGAEAAARHARTNKPQREEEAAAARAEESRADARVEETTLETKITAGSLVGEHFEGPERSGKVTMQRR